MNYKDTLLMPKTEFPMRGNLPENEKIMREKWEKENLYQLLKEQNKGNTPFVLHDGPPYANGSIHLGHAMNKILKDFVNRYKFMKGFDVTYIPGWDTHGLPIEQAITNKGVNRKELSKIEFRKLCEEYAYEQIDIQKEGFKALNVIADWDHPYITLQKEMEARQIEVFASMAKKGLIFRGLKPVYWSPSSESALAEAEIEYHDRTDSSIFVSFPIVKGNHKVHEGDYLVIWTTTPWTIPENSGIAVGVNFDYVKVLVNNQNYIIAADLLEDLAGKFGWDNYEIIETFKGHDLLGVTYKHPLNERISPVVDGFHVTLESGSGLVHIAPLYGADDFQIGQENNLEMVDGVDDSGHLTKEAGEDFAGLYFLDANKEVIKKLQEQNALLSEQTITHSYPHDWRTKKPIIFRATPQWFCSLDKIRDELLDAIDNKIIFHTSWGKTRLHNMIEDRGDWCISRQRVWGVPLPIFYNEDGTEILDYDVMMHIADLFRQYGSNIWFEKTAKELLPEGYTNSHSPNGNFTKEEDIMDVWFDSGSTHTGVLKERNLPYPADIYLEGSDQYRGWFNSSLITGIAVYHEAPYKMLISHGFTLDGKGNKMSKSLGNTISPSDIIKQHGSDILRLWVASTDFTEDVKLSDELIKQVKESYRKIRNTYKFLLGNLSNFTEEDVVAYQDMPLYDRYMLIAYNDYLKEVTTAYENYYYQDVYKATNRFITEKLSNFYLDFTKDILYIEDEKSLVRRSVQTVLQTILSGLIKVLAPILPYTSEEVYSYLSNDKSIHLEKFPEALKYSDEEEIKTLFNEFFALKEEVNRHLEEARSDKTIGSSQEAEVIIPDHYEEIKNKLGSVLHQLFIVSKVTFDKNVEHIVVSHSEGEKCERCWNYVEKTKDGICPRCQNILKQKK